MVREDNIAGILLTLRQGKDQVPTHWEGESLTLDNILDLQDVTFEGVGLKRDGFIRLHRARGVGRPRGSRQERRRLELLQAA